MSTLNSTLGMLSVNGRTTFFTLEDGYRENKVAGETQIPAGRYEIKYRTAGGMSKRYAERFPGHRGMIHLQNVKDFQFVYIHVGNYVEDTEGCILVGSGGLKHGKNCSITDSVKAYKELSQMIAEAFDSGERVFIDIVNDDRYLTMVNT